MMVGNWKTLHDNTRPVSDADQFPPANLVLRSDGSLSATDMPACLGNAAADCDLTPVSYTGSWKLIDDGSHGHMLYIDPNNQNIFHGAEVRNEARLKITFYLGDPDAGESIELIKE